MSTNTVHPTFDFLPARESKRRPQGVLNAIRNFFGSIREGLDAAHRYERLTGQGVSPQKAVEIVFREHFSDRR